MNLFFWRKPEQKMTWPADMKEVDYEGQGYWARYFPKKKEGFYYPTQLFQVQYNPFGILGGLLSPQYYQNPYPYNVYPPAGHWTWR